MSECLNEDIKLEQKKLINLYEKKGSFTDPEVLKQSRSLDEMIVKYLTTT